MSASESACRHEELVRGVCLRCGANVQTSSEADPQLRVEMANGITVTATRAEEMRAKNASFLLSTRRLCLILDLDETLVNTVASPTIPPPLPPAPPSPKDFTVREFSAGGFEYRVALRPYVEIFLRDLSQIFELNLYSFGNRIYVDKVLEHLDPDRTLFKGRVITRDENPESATAPSPFQHDEEDEAMVSIKLLQPDMGRASMALIVDDRSDVWKMSQRNLVQVEPFRVFVRVEDEEEGGRSSRGAVMSSPKDETLLNTMRKLRAIHGRFYELVDSGEGVVPDVRDVMEEMVSSVLKGTRIVFSRVIPLGTIQPASTEGTKRPASQQVPSGPRHPLVVETKRLGAVCVDTVSASTTHLVARDAGTAKVRQAAEMPSIKVVTANWLIDAIRTWTKPDEAKYALPGMPEPRPVSCGPVAQGALAPTDESSERRPAPTEVLVRQSKRRHMSISAERADLSFDQPGDPLSSLVDGPDAVAALAVGSEPKAKTTAKEREAEAPEVDDELGALIDQALSSPPARDADSVFDPPLAATLPTREPSEGTAAPVSCGQNVEKADDGDHRE